MQARRYCLLGTATTLAVIWFSGLAHADCTWSFNWYCSDCAKIGGRTTGTQSGYSSEAQCNSARSGVAREVTTGSCSSSGYCGDSSGSSRPPSGGARPSRGGGYQEPAIDYEAESRRAEEERMRQESEEAERRAREQAEEEHKQRQFLHDKLDTLKSLKGADFDGVGGGKPQLKGGSDDILPLKGGTTTLGIKPNPGQSDSPEQGNLELGSRYSKGSRFSAPVDLTTKDPAGPLTVESDIVRELVPGGHLGKFIAEQSWPPHIKGQTAIALIDLERGHPERAATGLKGAAKVLPKDEFFRRAASKAVDEAKKPHSKFDPGRFSQQLPKAAYFAYVSAWGELEKGNINSAARLFSRALDAAPNNTVLQQLVAETEKRRSVLSPEEQKQEALRIERARDYAQGNAALRLGLNAIHWDNFLALNYLDEASTKLSGLDWEFVRVTKQQVADRKYSAPGAYWKYRYTSRADAMLDALEYGKGDWEASLRYLKHAKKIQHNNPVIDAAYRDLESLSKEPLGR